MSKRIFIGAQICALSLFLAFTALPRTAAAEGDVESGKVLGYTCLGCHGIEGYRNPYPSYRVPKLGGQHAAYIELALKAYRSGERTHATMRAQAGSLSDQDIADLAAYFASQGEPVDGPVVTRGVAEGKEKSQTCTACHGERGISANAIWPNLAGQQQDYLVNALKQYKYASAERSDGYSVRNNAVMAGLAAALSDDDIDALAKYFAAQDGLYTSKHED
ncbi:MAG: c-type cytochrome [Pseudomonadota bacterium]